MIISSYIKKALRFAKKALGRLAQSPRVFLVSFLILKSRIKGRPSVVLEITTSHDIFCIYGVIKHFYQNGTLVIYTANSPLEESLREQILHEFQASNIQILDVAWTNWLPKIDFYINTTLSYDIHVPERARYKINFPHTITSKTKYDVFSPSISKISDTFITGPAYEKDLFTYCHDHHIEKMPAIHRLGGPKSDELFNGHQDREKFLKKLGLDPALKTVFYAPTYNQNTSIFTWLEEIVKLAENHKINLIIKVHPGAYLDPTSRKSSGGVDWKKYFSNENLKAKRIYNVINQDSTEYVRACDIAITDISTVWIEYYFLRKKMVFLDIPEFFRTHKMNSLGDFRNKYGTLVKNPSELNQTVADLLRGTFTKKITYDIDDLLLYNKGGATRVAVRKIEELYEKK